MQPTPDPYDYSTERLLRAKTREMAELRECAEQRRAEAWSVSGNCR